MRVAWLCVMALLFAVSPVLSQVSDDKLIVPGLRVGAWTLQMTVEEIVSALGRQTRIGSGGQLGSDLLQNIRVYKWERVGLNAYAKDGRSILLLEADNAPDFVTQNGITWGKSRADVERAYGQPTRVTQWGRDPAQVTLQYNEIGLEVFFTQTSTVGGIGVFRPGAASSIWKP